MSRVAVLASGGLDSAVLLARLTETYHSIHPLYVSCGLFWEGHELGFLKEFLSQFNHSSIAPLETLEFPMRDVYGQQWYVTGKGIPGYEDREEQWEIPGRNLILITKAAVWSKGHAVDQIAHGTLASNPFSDAAPDFFSLMEHVISRGLNAKMKIITPLRPFHKADVVRMGTELNLPLELTLSCPRPVDERHCGTCGKCRERIEAFAKVGLHDPAPYQRHPASL